MTRKIAFASCAYASKRKAQPAWARIRDAKPDLLILLGDNAYMSWGGNPQVPSDWRFNDLEECYRLQFQVTDFRWLVDNTPTLAIWDDHDCGPNDTMGATVPPAFLAATREKFDRWMGFARNDNRPHMYCSYLDIPEVQVIMLDVRTYRTPSSDPQATLLGAEQEAWLWQQLDPTITPQRRLTIVCSGTGFSKGATGQTVRDYKAFADKLIPALQFRAGGLQDVGRRSLFLAGDIHQNFFRPIKDTRIYEAISSGVACYGTRSGDSTIPANECDNWALMTIEPDSVRLQFFGQTVLGVVNAFEHIIRIDDWNLQKP